MPNAPVDNNGTQLFFTDSGPIKSSEDYTTLVIFHGSAFTGNTFHKLLPLGAAHNIRLVILNRRDYAGSTKYSDENLKDLQAGDKSFMERLALEVKHFLLWFIDTHNIPKITADRKSGGFVLMGWSMGNVTALSILGYQDVVGNEAYQRLEPYLRQLILYDPSGIGFGYERPPVAYNSFADVTPEAAIENFKYGVSGYYEHPDLASRSIDGLNVDKRGSRPSVDNMTAEEMAVNFDPIAAARTEFPMFIQMQPVLNMLTQTCLFDEKVTSEVLPKLEIAYLCCAKSPWYCLWGMIETERQYKKHLKLEHKVRPIQFLEIASGNHFVHWDDPEGFFACTVKAINS
ncbi:hypothetical protein M413DRAFT_444643 [Hebeloma cylindrosporum]|uniref:AB hydrolase-1 domain-containing protein n=1 Tax=Hebeloma cylindrosporum TaxID=76867 RepID=A0A0C3CD87_HEBCY|nr:hypothetical protein M413DRAFT_444643 [Hebeloma cylindrosporum h7]